MACGQWPNTASVWVRCPDTPAAGAVGSESDQPTIGGNSGLVIFESSGRDLLLSSVAPKPAQVRMSTLPETRHQGSVGRPDDPVEISSRSRDRLRGGRRLSGRDPDGRETVLLNGYNIGSRAIGLFEIGKVWRDRL